MSRVAARCPNCQSVFFVSAAQGKVANNLVRCGRCGHLFDVLENLSESLPEPEVVPERPETAIEPEPAIDGGFSDGEESLAIIDGDREQGAGENSAALDDVPVSTFHLPNLAAHLPDDFDLESTPVEKKGLGRQLSLALVIVIIALVGLAGQFVFFKLPTLSQQLSYRPWLQHFCTLLPCEVDTYRDHSLISVEHLKVRDHPDLKGILLVELVLINRASLEQAFPPLILRFDDLSGEYVAARRLSAVEYLPRSLSADRLMPVDKAVSIKLAILDPGDRALSYSVSVGQ